MQIKFSSHLLRSWNLTEIKNSHFGGFFCLKLFFCGFLNLKSCKFSSQLKSRYSLSIFENLFLHTAIISFCTPFYPFFSFVTHLQRKIKDGPFSISRSEHQSDLWMFLEAVVVVFYLVPILGCRCSVQGYSFRFAIRTIA